MQRILIVDDDRKVAASLRRELRRSFEVEVAFSASDALACLDAFGPDLVLSDFKMAGMNGAQLLAEVKRRRPQAVRVMMSGYADLDPAAPEMSDCDDVPFIRKPWGSNLPAQLSEMIGSRP